MHTTNKLFLALLSASLFLTGCVTDLKGSTYSRKETRDPITVHYGEVKETRPVVVEGTKTGIGAVIGGATGAVAAGGTGSSRSKQIARIFVATFGAFLGSKVEEGVTRVQGVELTVELDNGETYAYVQEEDPNTVFQPGDRVKVMSTYKGVTRVAPSDE